LLVVLVASRAGATPITVSDTFDWNASTNAGGTTYTTFSEPSISSWSQTLSLSPAASSFLSADVELRHAGNRGNGTQELWLLYDAGSILLGQLHPSSNAFHNFVTDTFTVPGSLLPSFPASQWTLSLRLADGIAGTSNTIALDYSTLTVDYEPVASSPSDSLQALTELETVHAPEPASLVLLGSGLLAGAWRLRKRF